MSLCNIKTGCASIVPVAPIATIAIHGGWMPPEFLSSDTPTTYKMRCPECAKPYSVQAQHLHETSEPLEFQCLGCKARFVVAPIAPESGIERTEVETMPAIERTVVTKAPLGLVLQRCPKCRAPNASGSTECQQCGIVFSKYNPDQPGFDISFVGRRELSELWDKVMRDYEMLSLHENFIDQCYKADCLPFASRKYATLLAAAPTEEIARAMRRRIVALASYRVDATSMGDGIKFRIPAFNGLVLFLGGVVFTMGVLIPGLKELCGVGLSAIFLGVGIRYFLRPQT